MEEGWGEHVALVIEPDPAKRAEASVILRSMGLKTYDTGCGAVGQFIATQLELSIVVLDAVLPDLDGVQLIRRIRALSPDALIVATAAPDEEWEATASAAHCAGADFTLSSLSAATLRAVLEESDAGSEDVQPGAK
jgi:DNA-binding response OmpR family regulator